MVSDDEEAPSSKTAEKFVVRLPRGMRRRIADVARQYRRSMNSEIVARLERSLNEPAPDFGEPSESLDPPTDGTADAPDETVTIENLTELELNLLRLFRNLPADRQRALIQLLS